METRTEALGECAHPKCPRPVYHWDEYVLFGGKPWHRECWADFGTWERDDDDSHSQ